MMISIIDELSFSGQFNLEQEISLYYQRSLLTENTLVLAVDRAHRSIYAYRSAAVVPIEAASTFELNEQRKSRLQTQQYLRDFLITLCYPDSKDLLQYLKLRSQSTPELRIISLYHNANITDIRASAEKLWLNPINPSDRELWVKITRSSAKLIDYIGTSYNFKQQCDFMESLWDAILDYLTENPISVSNNKLSSFYTFIEKSRKIVLPILENLTR